MNYIDFIKLYYSYVKDFSVNLLERRLLTGEEKGGVYNDFTKSPFISSNFKSDLSEKIINSDIYDNIYVVNSQQGQINFHFISDRSEREINKLKKYYFFLIYIVLNKKQNRKFLKNIYINIITINKPKKISNPISINDINSASTIIYPEFGGPIYIWRSDELEKVLIHETLHSLLYDYDIIQQELNPDLKKLENIIDKNGKGLNINEAYTELCAVFIMCLFKIGKKNAKTIILKNLNKMLIHSLKTCAKLLKKFNVDNPRQCTIVNNLHQCSYHQEASAYSYIVIKTGLLWAILKNSHLRDGKIDRVKCLEEFLSIGFTGTIGPKYQEMIVDILKNNRFNRAIERYMGKVVEGNLYFSIFHS